MIPREEMSLDRIREWMRANPESAEEVRRQNRSFVFFRIAGLSDDREAVGAQGVPLTPGRSIAVDNSLHVYGTPFFIQAGLPLNNEKRTAGFDRLDDRARHRLSDRWSGARGHLLGSRRSGGPDRWPAPSSWQIRDACAA